MTEPATGTEGGDDDDAYGGVVGAFPYAMRETDSWILRSYALFGGVLSALIVLLFGLGLVGVVASTTGTKGGVFTFSRTFFIFVGLLVVAPLLAPVLSVARRHRRVGSDRRSDAAMGLAGYGFLVSLYLAVVVSIPPEQQHAVSGPLAPAVQFFYDLPGIAGLAPPVVAGVGIYLVHRLTR